MSLVFLPALQPAETVAFPVDDADRLFSFCFADSDERQPKAEP